jgi:hypothetical protein
MRSFLLSTLFVLSYSILCAQGEANSLEGVPFKERIVTGGGFGLGFSSTQSYFSVSPVIGYQITKKLIAGTSVTYRYNSYKFSSLPALKLNDYGVNPFVRFTVYRNIFLQTEYEYLNYEFPVTYTETVRKTFTGLLGGGGFTQPLGDKVAVYFMALYNFSYDEANANQYAVYNSPLIIRAGINVGNFLSF